MKSEGGGREFDLRPAIRHFPSAFILCPLNKLSAISRHPVSGIQYPASGIQHPASSIRHPASSISLLESNFRQRDLYGRIRAHTAAFVAVFAEKFGDDRPAVLDPDGGVRTDLDAQRLRKTAAHAAFIQINLSSHNYTPDISFRWFRSF
jgi:hypothetical protein